MTRYLLRKSAPCLRFGDEPWAVQMLYVAKSVWWGRVGKILATEEDKNVSEGDPDLTASSSRRTQRLLHYMYIIVFNI